MGASSIRGAPTGAFTALRKRSLVTRVSSSADSEPYLVVVVGFDFPWEDVFLLAPTSPRARALQAPRRMLFSRCSLASRGTCSWLHWRNPLGETLRRAMKDARGRNSLPGKERQIGRASCRERV